MARCSTERVLERLLSAIADKQVPVEEYEFAKGFNAGLREAIKCVRAAKKAARRETRKGRSMSIYSGDENYPDEITSGSFEEDPDTDEDSDDEDSDLKDEDDDLEEDDEEIEE